MIFVILMSVLVLWMVVRAQNISYQEELYISRLNRLKRDISFLLINTNKSSRHIKRYKVFLSLIDKFIDDRKHITLLYAFLSYAQHSESNEYRQQESHLSKYLKSDSDLSVIYDKLLRYNSEYTVRQHLITSGIIYFSSIPFIHLANKISKVFIVRGIRNVFNNPRDLTPA